MAPEQARGEAVDHRADIWSFGLVLYEMAKGTRPAPAVRLRVEESPELERVISKCLETDRDLRYQHAADLRTDLERLKRGSDSALTGRDQLPAKARARWTVVAAAAAAIALAAVGYIFYPRQATLTDKDTHRARRVHQHDGRPGVRRHAATRTRGAASAVAVPEPHLRRTHPENAAIDEPAGGCTTDPRRCAGRVRSDGRRGGPAGIDCGAWQSVRPRAARNQLRDRGHPRRRAGTGVAERRCPEHAQPDGDSVPNAGWRIARHHREILDAARGDDAVARSAAGLQRRIESRPCRLAVRALPLFQRAVAIDPDFALAHAHVGFRYGAMGESALARQSLLKAYQLRNRASDVERFYIETLYDRDFTGNLERERRTLETWAESYPRDARPHTLIAGLALSSTGQHELAIAETEKAIALDPDAAPAYGNRAFNQLMLNRLDDALLTVRLAAERKLESADLLLTQYFVAFLTGNENELRRTVTAARKSPATEDIISHIEALALARSGQLQDARRMAAVAVQIAQKSGRRERAGLFEAASAVWEAFYGNAAAARQSATRALELGRGGREVDYAAAFALALAGDLPQSQALAEVLAREFPEDTSVQFMYLPTLRALFSLNTPTPDAAAAIQALQTASRYDLALGRVGFIGRFGGLYPIYVRGLAYLAARQPAEAAAEFQRILDHRSIVLVDPMDAMARLQLARALALSGDTVKAKSAYSDLLTLWKNADPDIPVLKEARAEYARLP